MNAHRRRCPPSPRPHHARCRLRNSRRPWPCSADRCHASRPRSDCGSIWAAPSSRPSSRRRRGWGRCSTRSAAPHATRIRFLVAAAATIRRKAARISSCMPRRSTAPGGAHARISAIGGQVIQKQVTPALADLLHITSEPIPPVATDSGHRTTPDVFGFGLLDAVPDAVILARADPLDRNGDGISGRPNRTADGRLGRFGRKAQAATLREFNAEAFVMEMGVTNPGSQTEQTIAGEPLPPGVDPLPEPEISAAQLDAVDAFVRFLAPPPRALLGLLGARGAVVFSRIGCASCHTPVLVTGASPIVALRRKVVRAYTDLLLHDMGPDLADICLGQAQPSEFRVAARVVGFFGFASRSGALYVLPSSPPES